MLWPADADEALENLSFAIGTPFPWRKQMPLFHFDIIMYTFVLAGEHAGEIWRYEISPDAWDGVRAATSLATLLTQWAAGITSGVVTYRDLDQWLFVGADVQDPFQLLLDRSADLDPFAFPVSVPYSRWPLLRDRQRECGVDMECIERGADCQFELLDAIDAARAALPRVVLHVFNVSVEGWAKMIAHGPAGGCRGLGSPAGGHPLPGLRADRVGAARGLALPRGCGQRRRQQAGTWTFLEYHGAYCQCAYLVS